MPVALDDLNAALGITSALISARGLEAHAEAGDLVVAERYGKREYLLTPAAAEAWQTMKARAQSEGIDLFLISAFRSIERQAEIIQRKLEAGQSLADILRVNAPPGFSEHHTGCAVDISTAGCTSLALMFDTTPAFAWLKAQASTYGFRLSYPPDNPGGYQYEPWHWCYAAP